MQKWLEKIRQAMGKQPMFWRWLGILLIFFGLVIIWRAQMPISSPTDYENYGELNILPSGEEMDLTPVDLSGIDLTSKNGNWIVIPKMGVDSAIFEGGEEMLNQGVWHLPRTSTPDQGGNTVLSAHRWLYKPPDPRTFWNIDKIEVGDEVYVKWQDKEYTYRVISTEVVTPDRVDILRPTKEPILTFFSCTPLYSTSHRLVVKAELVE